MQHLSSTLEGSTISDTCSWISNPGEVPRLSSNWTTWSTTCADPRLFLWVLALRPYFPGGILNALATTLRGSKLPMSSMHRLGRGLLGYLIPFATHAFAAECQENTNQMLSPLVFHMISTHFTATPYVPLVSCFLKIYRFRCGPDIECRDLTSD